MSELAEPYDAIDSRPDVRGERRVLPRRPLPPRRMADDAFELRLPPAPVLAPRRPRAMMSGRRWRLHAPRASAARRGASTQVETQPTTSSAALSIVAMAGSASVPAASARCLLYTSPSPRD